MIPPLNKKIQSSQLLAISLDEAAIQCRLSPDELDAIDSTSLTNYIQAAQELLENKYNIAFGTATYQATIPTVESEFDKIVTIPIRPFAAVASVAVNGQTTSDYTVTQGSNHTQVCIPSLSKGDKVVIDYTAGFATAASVPPSVKLSVALLTSHYFDNRNPQTNSSINNIGYAIESLMLPFTKLTIA